MDAQEPGGTEKSIEDMQTLPREVGAFPGVEPHVISFGLDPIDRLDVQQDDPRTVAYSQAPG